MRVSIIIVFLCLIFTIFSLVIGLNLKSKVEEMMIKIENQNKKPINIGSGILLNNL